jgi:hypothetical protein
MTTQAMNPTANKCAHPGCNCQVGPGEQFCSTACEDSVKQGSAQGKGSEDCGCNHQGCAIAA